MHLRRATGVIALTGALALMPATATAGTYPAPEQPEVTSSLPGTVAAVGDPFTMTIAADDGSEVTLTVQNDDVPDSAIQIAGQASHAKIAQGGGATFSVTLANLGTFVLTTAIDGLIVSTHTITVIEAAADAAAQDPGDTAAGAADGTAPGAEASGAETPGAPAPGAGGADTDTSGTDTSGSARSILPVSGTEAAFFAVGAVLLLGAGTTAIIAARRRARP